MYIQRYTPIVKQQAQGFFNIPVAKLEADSQGHVVTWVDHCKEVSDLVAQIHRLNATLQCAMDDIQALDRVIDPVIDVSLYRELINVTKSNHGESFKLDDVGARGTLTAEESANLGEALVNSTYRSIPSDNLNAQLAPVAKKPHVLNEYYVVYFDDGKTTGYMNTAGYITQFFPRSNAEQMCLNKNYTVREAQLILKGNQ